MAARGEFKAIQNDNTPLSESKIRPSVKAMLEYSTYLAGFEA